MLAGRYTDIRILRIPCTSISAYPQRAIISRIALGLLPASYCPLDLPQGNGLGTMRNLANQYHRRVAITGPVSEVQCVVWLR